MRVNKYAGNCTVCGARVPAGGGTLEKVGRRWSVTHLACQGGDPAVISIRFQGDPKEYYQNRNGRCEDAPCCGCCNI